MKDGGDKVYLAQSQQDIEDDDEHQQFFDSKLKGGDNSAGLIEASQTRISQNEFRLSITKKIDQVKQKRMV